MCVESRTSILEDVTQKLWRVLWMCCGDVLWMCCEDVLWMCCGCVVDVLCMCCGCVVDVLWMCCGCVVEMCRGKVVEKCVMQGC